MGGPEIFDPHGDSGPRRGGKPPESAEQVDRPPSPRDRVLDVLGYSRREAEGLGLATHTFRSARSLSPADFDPSAIPTWDSAKESGRVLPGGIYVFRGSPSVEGQQLVIDIPSEDGGKPDKLYGGEVHSAYRRWFDAMYGVQTGIIGRIENGSGMPDVTEYLVTFYPEIAVPPLNPNDLSVIPDGAFVGIHGHVSDNNGAVIKDRPGNRIYPIILPESGSLFPQYETKSGQLDEVRLSGRKRTLVEKLRFGRQRTTYAVEPVGDPIRVADQKRQGQFTIDMTPPVIISSERADQPNPIFGEALLGPTLVMPVVPDTVSETGDTPVSAPQSLPESTPAEIIITAEAGEERATEDPFALPKEGATGQEIVTKFAGLLGEHGGQTDPIINWIQTVRSGLSRVDAARLLVRLETECHHAVAKKPKGEVGNTVSREPVRQVVKFIRAGLKELVGTSENFDVVSAIAEERRTIADEAAQSRVVYESHENSSEHKE